MFLASYLLLFLKKSRSLAIKIIEAALMINYYVVLEIPNFSEETVIKKAYRKLSKKYHPDVNKDPFAHTYFLKINEAYDFLMDANKRFLLHQYLHTVQHAAATNSQETNHVHQKAVAPDILLFAVDKKYFKVGDYILLQWNISNCRRVHISLLGDVHFSGTHYIKMEHFTEEFIILMTVEATDGTLYKYQIKLLYDNSNPVQAAFEKIKAQFPQVDEIHFKKETFFGMNARINGNEFKNRMLFLGTLQAICLVFFILTSLKVILFLLGLILFWLTFAQLYKRAHDTLAYKNKVYYLFVPFYNLYIAAQLFKTPTEPAVNEFGMLPTASKHTFLGWIQQRIGTINQHLTKLQKISMGSFVLLWLVVFIKASVTYNEQPMQLTNHYTETSRPSKQSGINVDYYLVFNEKYAVNVSEDQFYQIVHRKAYNRFALAQERSGEVAYVRMTNSETQQTDKLRFGVLQSSNPLLLLVSLLFLSQLYVWQNLTAPKEKSFANGYMIFALLFYLYGILVTVF